MTQQNETEKAYQLRLPATFFSGNRKSFCSKLGSDDLVILSAGSAPLRTADEHYRFFANRNFFYLTGIEQEDAILVLSIRKLQIRSILFLPPSDPLAERWNGKRLDTQTARDQSGLTEIQTTDTFAALLGDFLSTGYTRVWVDQTASDARARLIRDKIGEQSPDLEPRDLDPILRQLRMIKQPEEIRMIRKAIRLAWQGIEAMLRVLEPGRFEYELWAAYQHELASQGLLETAFHSIVASGRNALCLHYMTPRDEIAADDLVQIDVGALVGGLCSDISRALPASGKFSPRQLDLYKVVRACQETAFAQIRPGIQIKDVNESCKQTAARGLKALGILTDDGDASDYYWHNVSHHLGMDVHDLANKDATIQPGMVLTVEPGVYIPEWSLGFRIEDDVLVTETGCENLSADLPREASEIEAALQKAKAGL